LACGWNYAGQLGDGTTHNRSSFVSIMTGVQGMAAGDYHSLILKTDGSLWACGENGSGQLGDSTFVDRITPVKVCQQTRGIDAGGWHSVMVKTDGTIWTCGWLAFDSDSYGSTFTSPTWIKLTQ
jgi:alpha-tubulin suppressor-like RCC1 family protein